MNTSALPDSSRAVLKPFFRIGTDSGRASVPRRVFASLAVLASGRSFDLPLFIGLPIGTQDAEKPLSSVQKATPRELSRSVLRDVKKPMVRWEIQIGRSRGT